MLKLDSPVWKVLGGSDIPILLQALQEDPGGGAWQSLMDILVDQGDVLDAAFAAVPHVLSIAESQPVPAQVNIWHFIGYVASKGPNYAPNLPEDVRKAYSRALVTAKHRILDAIKSQSVNEEETVVMIQALAAVSGCYGPGRILRDTVCLESTRTKCPSCNRILNLEVRSTGILIRTNETLTGRAHRETRITAIANHASGAVLSTEGLVPEHCKDWLPRMAEAGGHPTTATKIRTLYQDATCPECGAQFPLMDELGRVATFNLG
jgi:hypothetical protein